MPKLPNFFLVGAPKAGTTSLYHYLDQHPEIYMSAIKEPHFFACEIREENFTPEVRRTMEREKRELREFLSGSMRRKRFGGIVPDWQDYLRLFANATEESALGEASVCYLWSPTAAAAIAERLPNAKILAMLRNPVDRAFSQYLHGLSNGVIHWSFREHILRNQQRRSDQICVHYPFLEFGFYSAQLRRYMELFGRNVWVGIYDDFLDNPAEVFLSICRFLEVAPFSPEMGARRLESQVPRSSAISWLRRSGLWQAAASLTPTSLRPMIRRGLTRKPGMDVADRQHLIDFYRQDVTELATLLGRNLDPWLR